MGEWRVEFRNRVDGVGDPLGKDWSAVSEEWFSGHSTSGRGMNLRSLNEVLAHYPRFFLNMADWYIFRIHNLHTGEVIPMEILVNDD